MRRFILIAAFGIFCAAVLVGYALLPASLKDGRVTAVVPQGASAKQAAAALRRAGAIRSAATFVLLARLSGRAGDLKPGQYELRQDMSPLGVLDKIARGEVAAGWLTIPEGFTVRQIADLLAKEEIADRTEFIRLALHGEGRPADFPPAPANMEGYLFPDTYLMPRGFGAASAAKLMYDNFARRVWRPLNAEIHECDLALLSGASSRQPTDYERLSAVITLASLVEREARTDGDRALISGVLWNRLRRGMKLDVDATVQYALGEHRQRLLYRDLSVDSSYNTYRNAGLPPGPIANPGMQSIKAALNPAECPYLYYVAGPNGSHVFSATLQEHNRAAARIRAERNRDSGGAAT